MEWVFEDAPTKREEVDNPVLTWLYQSALTSQPHRPRATLSLGGEAAATLDEATADGIKLRLKRRWIRGQPAP